MTDTAFDTRVFRHPVPNLLYSSVSVCKIAVQKFAVLKPVQHTWNSSKFVY